MENACSIFFIKLISSNNCNLAMSIAIKYAQCQDIHMHLIICFSSISLIVFRCALQQAECLTKEGPISFKIKSKTDNKRHPYEWERMIAEDAYNIPGKKYIIYYNLGLAMGKLQ